MQIAEYDGTAGTYSWTPPVSLATNAPNSTQLVVTIITKTYNGTAYVGRSECAVTLAIPASEVPSLKVAVSDPTNVKTNYGGYFVQLRSKIAVTITGTGVRGSTIKSYSIKVGSAAGSGNIYAESASSGTTDFLPVSGTVWVTCTVTDSRGRTASKSIDYKVVPYSTPTIVAISATRCTQDGTVDRMGAYAKVTFSATITKLYGNNTAAYQVQYRKYGTTDAWTVVAAPASGDYEPKNIYIVFPADKSKRYTVRVVATDAFVSNYSSLRDIPAAFVLLDFAKRLLSVGIGRLCDKSNALQIGIDTYFDKLVDARKLYMRGDDQEKTIFFQTSEEAGNKHNVQIFGGNGASPTAIGLYDARNGYSVAKYNDAEKKLYAKNFPRYARVLGIEDELADPRCENEKTLADSGHIADLTRRIRSIMLTKTSYEWEKLFTEADLVFSRLNHFKDVQHDQQAWDNEYLEEVTFANGVKNAIPRPPVHLSGYEQRRTVPLGRIGENTDDILHGLGYSQDRINDLRSRKCIQ